ncbi:hypothetical protein Lal_00016939 [Lupinus albus]|nr:hypothetical protein Lal_00016939 [Lupinus albus]
MASKNLQIADLESSGDSGSAGSSKTNTKTYKCIECFKPFPTRLMLIQHQREDEPCRRSQMIKTLNKNTLNPLSFPQPILQSLPSPSSSSSPSIHGRNISTLELLSPMLSSSSSPPPPPPPPVQPNATNLALYPTFPPLSPSIVELNTSILAPSPTLPQPSLPNVKSYISNFAPGLAPLPSPYDAENATNYHHAYLMQEIMSIDAAAATTAYGGDDYCFSPDNRTLDLISQLDPTRNFLCLIDQQSEEQSGNNVNGADAAPDPSVEMGSLELDLDFKI